MPRVPVLDTPQVRTEALPGARVQADFRGTTADAIAPGLQQVDQGVQQLGAGMEEYKRKADGVMVQQAVLQLQPKIDDTLDNPDTGIMSAPGLQAWNRANGGAPGSPAKSDDYLTRLKKAQDEAAKSLQNDEQRAIFAAHAAQLVETARNRVTLHLGQQAEVAQKASNLATQDSALKAVFSAGGDSETLITQRARVQQAIGLVAASPEDAQHQLATWDSNVAKSLISSAVANKDWAKAHGWLNGPLITGADGKARTGRELLGEDAPPIERAVNELGESVRSDTQASGIVAAAKVKGYDWVDPAQAEKQVAALPAGPLKDEVAKRVDHLVQQSEALKKKTGEDHLNSILAAFHSTGNPNDPSIAVHKAYLLDPHNDAAGLWDRWTKELEQEARATKSSDAEARRAQAEADKLVVDLFKSKDTADQAKANIEVDYLGSASPIARAEMAVVQKHAKAEIAKDGGVGEAEFMRTALGAATDAKITDKAQVAAFKAYMVDWRMKQLEANGGKPIPRADAMKGIAEALQTVDAGHMWSFSHPRFAVPPEDQGTVHVLPAEKQKSPLNRSAAPAAAAAPLTVPGSAPPPPTGPKPTGPKMTLGDQGQIIEAFTKRWKRRPTDSEISTIFNAKHGAAQ